MCTHCGEASGTKGGDAVEAQEPREPQCEITSAAAQTVRTAIVRATERHQAAGVFTAYTFGAKYSLYGQEEADEDGVVVSSEVGKLCNAWRELWVELFRK